MKALSEHPFGQGGLLARKFQLDNGLGVILVADRAVPVCAYQTWFRVGSRDERVGKTGIAHLFEHLMFNQTEKLAPGEFDRRLETVGADTNAATWLDWTYYRENVPSQHLELVMDLEVERMAHLVVEAPQLESERSVVSNERRQRVDDDVEGFLEEELYRLAYRVHPYRWPTIGWMADIQAIELADARAFYRTFYAPNNATVVIVGDLDEERTLSSLAQRYGHLAPQEIVHPAYEAEPAQEQERRAVFDKTVLSERAIYGYHAVALDHADHAPLEVLAELFINGQSSILHKKLIVESELCSELGASVPGFRDPGLFEVRVSMQRPHPLSRAEAIIDEAVAQLARAPVDDPIIKKAQNRLAAQHFRQLRTMDGKAEGLGHHETTTGDYRLLFDAAARVRAVTAADVQRVARTYLDPRRRNVVVAAPRRASTRKSQPAKKTQAAASANGKGRA